MSQIQKLFLRILSGTQDSNLSFADLQPKNGKAKAYQVKQVRNLILKYQLGGELDV